MKVKIIKCSGPIYWYKEYVGQVFEVDNITRPGGLYRVLNITPEIGDYLDIVDCMILEDYRNKRLNELGI